MSAIEVSGDLRVTNGTLYLPNLSGTNGGALVVDTSTGEVSVGAKPGEGGGAGPVDATKVGEIRTWARATIPDDCVLADGGTYTQADYPELYAVAVAEQTAGNPLWTANTSAKTFTVPDLRNRFIYGKGAKSLGATGGSETHTLTVSEMPSHSHAINAYTTNHEAGGHGTRVDAHGFQDRVLVNVSGGQSSAAAGSGQAHNNMPPYVVLAFIVQAKPVAVSEGGELVDGSVTEQKLADGAVTTQKLANGAVTAAKIDYGDGLEANGNKLQAKLGAGLAFDGSGAIEVTGGGGSGGAVRWRGAWSSATSYDKDDVVSYSGYYWRAVSAHSGVTAPSSSTNWTLFLALVAGASITFTPRQNAIYRIRAEVIAYPSGVNNGTYLQAYLRDNGSPIHAAENVGYIDNWAGYRQYQYQHWSREVWRDAPANVARTYDITYNNNQWAVDSNRLIIQEIAHA